MTVQTSEAMSASHVSSDVKARSEASRDWWPVAAEWTAEEADAHRPVRVVRPADEAGVVDAVRSARDEGLAVVTRGAGSGVVGGIVSRHAHLSVDLSRLSGFRLDKERNVVTARAGQMAGALERELNAQGHTLGHYPQSLYLASVGGLIATRSSGTFSNKYGGIEHLVEGLRVVLADGSVCEYRSTPRSATGPWLLPAFVGSEGSLGIITEATLRVFRLAEKRSFVGYSFPDMAACLAATREAIERHVFPAVLRVYEPTEAQRLYEKVGLREDRPLLIVGHDGAAAMVDAEERLFAEIVEAHGAAALGHEIGTAWEEHRYNADWLVKGNEGTGRMADAIEVSAGWPDLLPIYEEVRRRIEQDCALFMAHLSHFYTTGAAIYFIFALDEAEPAVAREKYTRIWETVMEVTLSHRGSISHHHGVGLARAHKIKEDLGSAHDVLSRVKEALDPGHILNPGKLGLGEVRA